MSLVIWTAGALASLDLTVDKEGVGGLTGLTPTVALRVAGSANYLDWSDLTFKNAGWTTKDAPMAALDRGHYARVLNLASIPVIVSGMMFVAEFYVDGGPGLVGTAHDYVAVESVNADVTLLRKGLTNRLEELSGNPGTLKLYDDDGITVIKTWQLRDETGGLVAPALNTPGRRSAAT